jgi:hypothetical protein
VKKQKDGTDFEAFFRSFALIVPISSLTMMIRYTKERINGAIWPRKKKGRGDGALKGGTTVLPLLVQK